MRATGQDVVAFAAGEPDFDVPDYVKEAAFKAHPRRDAASTRTRWGSPELRRLVSNKFKSDGFPFETDQVIVTSGAKHAIYGALYTVCEPGDEVLFPAPYWNSYPDMVRAVEAVPVPVPTRLEDGYEPDACRAAQGAHPEVPRADPEQPEQPDRRRVLEARARGDRRRRPRGRPHRHQRRHLRAPDLRRREVR